MAGDEHDTEPEPRHGKHRRGSAGATWTPEISWTTEPMIDTRFDPPPTGLRKFNLGTIPASVTPPSTWRRAAAFAVASAALVVGALGFATHALVGNPRVATTIDGLPGQPSQHLVITGLPADSAGPPTGAGATGPAAPTSRPAPSTSQPGPPSDTERSVRTDVPAPVVPAAAGSGDPADSAESAGPADRPPAGNRPPAALAPPGPMETFDVLVAPTDPRQLGDRTARYFTQVTHNPAAAVQMTSGPLRAEGPGGIQTRYANLARIEVRWTTVDSTSTFTRSRLVLVRKDGTSSTVERELTFSAGSNPKIIGDRLVG
ncbi:MAG: hypothetical protein ACJ72N_18930 [Labedaea sp.]